MPDYTEMQKLVAMITDVNNRLSDIHAGMILIKDNQSSREDEFIDHLGDQIFELNGWTNDCYRAYFQIKDPAPRKDIVCKPLIVTFVTIR